MTHTLQPIATGRQQQGVMLIEALVGILIFSIGIVALIGLQAAAISSTNDAKNRSDAAFLANQIVSQMWADKPNILNYATTGSSSYAPVQRWLTEVNNTLPGVAGAPPVITVVQANSVVYGANEVGYNVTVRVRWKMPSEAPADPPHQFITTARFDYQ